MFIIQLVIKALKQKGKYNKMKNMHRFFKYSQNCPKILSSRVCYIQPNFTVTAIAFTKKSHDLLFQMNVQKCISHLIKLMHIAENIDI